MPIARIGELLAAGFSPRLRARFSPMGRSYQIGACGSSSIWPADRRGSGQDRKQDYTPMDQRQVFPFLWEGHEYGVAGGPGIGVTA